jgi:pSer/pThr/pTyr-binding forkhead associated (FHA) protein
MSSADSHTAEGPGERGLIVGSAVDDTFRAACGIAGAIVVTIRHRERENDDPVRHVIGHPSVLIGRGIDCDISLQDPTVSYRHAYLQLLDEELFCFDLKSRSGTFCRSVRHRSGPLAMEEEIFIGPFSLVISTEEFEDNVEADVAPLSPVHRADSVETVSAVPEMVLKFLNGSPRPEPLALNRPVTLIGKSGRCRVKLADDRVSRVHCSIVRTPRGVWVVDLLGKGAPLNEGDELTVGGFRMHVLAAATSCALTRGKAAIARRTKRSANDREIRSQERQQSQSSETGHGPASEPTLIPQPVVRPLAGGPGGSTFSESFVISLVDQFAAMQQQMFEQSQQTMTAMAEILRSHHEAEVGLVHDEMAQIRALSQELQGLSRQLLVRAIEDVRSISNQPVDAVGQCADAAAPPQQAEDVGTISSEILTTESPVIADNKNKNDSDEDDSHDWLSQRIAAIEQERTIRWQKITRLLSGATADDRIT